MNTAEAASAILKSVRNGGGLSEVIAIITESKKELQHFKDTSTGLWCIDRNPKEVTKEWVDRNSFQI